MGRFLALAGSAELHVCLWDSELQYLSLFHLWVVGVIFALVSVFTNIFCHCSSPSPSLCVYMCVCVCVCKSKTLVTVLSFSVR